MGESIEDVLQNVNEAYKDIYRTNWSTIKTSVRIGQIRDVYHFLVIEYNNSLVKEYVDTIDVLYNRDLKINVAFGFILKNVESGELKFFHPSNNNMLFDTPKLVQNNNFDELYDDLERSDVFEYARNQRLSTKWTVEKIVCMRFDVYKL